MNTYIMKDILVFVKVLLSDTSISTEYHFCPHRITVSKNDTTITLPISIITQLGGLEYITDNAQLFYNGLTGNGRQDEKVNGLIHSVAMELSAR